MICGQCKGKTSVSNSYQRSDGSVQRRHKCLDCGHKFKSREYDEGQFVLIRKSMIRECRKEIVDVLDVIESRL